MLRSLSRSSSPYYLHYLRTISKIASPSLAINIFGQNQQKEDANEDDFEPVDEFEFEKEIHDIEYEDPDETRRNLDDILKHYAALPVYATPPEEPRKPRPPIRPEETNTELNRNLVKILHQRLLDARPKDPELLDDNDAALTPDEELPEYSTYEGKKAAIFIMGTPGAGKSTQIVNMTTRFDAIVHITLERALQQEMMTRSQLGAHLRNKKRQQIPFSPAEMVYALDRHMRWCAKQLKNGPFFFMIDGFPTTESEYNAWKAQMNGRIEVPFCISIEVKNSSARDRLAGKKVAVTEIENRILHFSKHGMPLIKAINQDGISTVKCSADNNPFTVFLRVGKILERRGFYTHPVVYAGVANRPKDWIEEEEAYGVHPDYKVQFST
eukprot:TRINITY_DN6837_c0_g1_i1.p1 TRINITY_DN6837_c0_g1~~TRINITY_DN6837_c0_g1_i1.p1  ORF type:complete len:382 (+),score=99.33 TRINITY_DN6837_c0_g1_i1:26-1171(+)